jgi:superfamily II DNA or RNA helicase
MLNFKKVSPKNRETYLELANVIENLKKNNLINSYLGNKGYSIYKVCLTTKIIDFIKDELTLKPVLINSLVETKSFPAYQESEKKIYVPRYWGINMFGYPKTIKIQYGATINLKFNGTLRDYQLKVLNEYLKAIDFVSDTTKNITNNKGNGSALIELWTGAGKTVLGLKIIEVLRKKTIIFVHKSFLKDQWIERITQYLPNAKIGLIQGPIVDIENKDIVLAMIQSVSMKTYPDTLFDSFGLSVYDECFKGSTLIYTSGGCVKISNLYKLWKQNRALNIRSYNRTSKTFEYKPLTYAWKKKSNQFVKLTLNNERNTFECTIECTLNHKILTPNDYVEAHKLNSGSKVLSKSGTSKEVVLLEVVKQEFIFSEDSIDVYDIEVADNHNYILANIVTGDTIQIKCGPIVSNCHHMSSEVFSNCLKKCNTLYGLGLSATMDRKDGLTKLFKMHLGEICYKPPKNSSQDNVLVKAIDYIVENDDDYNEVERDYRGNVKYSTMVSKISNYNRRSDFIIYILESELFINPHQQFIVLAQTKNLLNYLFDSLTHKKIACVGYYIGGMKMEELKKSESKQIILATYSMAAEALDIKSLTSLFLASPKSDIIQAVGRILREKHASPLVIDLIDNHDVFLNQFNKRRAFYNEKNYKIIRSNNEKYYDYIKHLKTLKNKRETETEIETETETETENNNNQTAYWKTLIPNSRKKASATETTGICLI